MIDANTHAVLFLDHVSVAVPRVAMKTQCARVQNPCVCRAPVLRRDLRLQRGRRRADDDRVRHPRMVIATGFNAALPAGCLVLLSARGHALGTHL
jgi:hypothetical protein